MVFQTSYTTYQTRANINHYWYKSDGCSRRPHDQDSVFNRIADIVQYINIHIILAVVNANDMSLVVIEFSLSIIRMLNIPDLFAHTCFEIELKHETATLKFQFYNYTILSLNPDYMCICLPCFECHM